MNDREKVEFKMISDAWKSCFVNNFLIVKKSYISLL